MPEQYQEFVDLSNQVKELEPDVSQELRLQLTTASLFNYFYEYTNEYKEVCSKIIEDTTNNPTILERDVELRREVDIKLENIKCQLLFLQVNTTSPVSIFLKKWLRYYPHQNSMYLRNQDTFHRWRNP